MGPVKIMASLVMDGENTGDGRRRNCKDWDVITKRKEVKHEAAALPPVGGLLTWTQSVPYVQLGENTLINSKDLL